MHTKPRRLLDRNTEWSALTRLIDKQDPLGVVYGPRRVGKSFLLESLCRATGGHRYQAIATTQAAQLADFGTVVGEWLDSGPLKLDGWSDALSRLARLKTNAVVIDEFPYLLEAAPELASVIQRHVDAKLGPPIVLSGSSVATMTSLIDAREPLFGRSSAVVVPQPFHGPDLSKLWNATNSRTALAVDAIVGGLPGYRPLLQPPSSGLDAWMIDEVLAPTSPLLDAAEAAFTDLNDISPRGIYRAILTAIANGERTFGGIAQKAGMAATALPRPMAALERSGLVVRVPDPIRRRRDTYDLADPHLRAWLTIIAPHRSSLLAGRSDRVWTRVKETTWPAQVLGSRWESVVRRYVAHHADALFGPADVVGTTTVSDRTARTSREIDIIATMNGQVVALGETKLRRLEVADAERLRQIRELLKAPSAKIILASAKDVAPEASRAADVIALGPDDVY